MIKINIYAIKCALLESVNIDKKKMSKEPLSYYYILSDDRSIKVNYSSKIFSS